MGNDCGPIYPFNGSNGQSYTPNGTIWNLDEDEQDLVELIQDENGWIPWKATKDSVCPVPEDTTVLIRLRNKTEDVRHAGRAYWDETPGPWFRVEAYKVVE